MTRATSGMSDTTFSRRRVPDVLLVTNFVVFQVAWLSSVIGGAQQMPWLGPLTVMIALGLHFRAARYPFEELLPVAALINIFFQVYWPRKGPSIA